MTSSLRYFDLHHTLPRRRSSLHLVSHVPRHAGGCDIDIIRYSEDAGNRVRVDHIILPGAHTHTQSDGEQLNMGPWWVFNNHHEERNNTFGT